MNSHLQDEIDAIQSRRNFNPKLGAKQVPEELRADYSALVELIERAKAEGITVSIPYNLAGQDVRIPVSEIKWNQLQGPRTRPLTPRKGTHAYTLWKLDQIQADHPEVPHADLLWASKKVSVEDATSLVNAARSRAK